LGAIAPGCGGNIAPRCGEENIGGDRLTLVVQKKITSDPENIKKT